jgi:DNA helicase-2/ATP-dependent DNA helicase PcrA
VLFRVNAQSAALEEAFAEAGIPVVLRGTERFFDRPEVREATTRLRGAARSGEVGTMLGDTVRAVLSVVGWTSQAPTTAGAVREKWESLSALVALADELALALDQSLSSFVTELDTRAELQHAPVADGVTLSSIHAAKGLEWAAVFVVGCSEGLMPLQYAETDEQIEEERRLLYVAITRAADRLVLSWSRSRNPGGRASRERSRFLDRLGVRAGADAPQVHRGSGKAREERRRTGPARCRICRKGLVTAQERTLGRCLTCPSDLNEALLEALRGWRLQESRDAQVPAYVVFTDRTLLAIAEQQPMDLDALADIPGVGPAKLERYAQALLRLVEESQSS